MFTSMACVVYGQRVHSFSLSHLRFTRDNYIQLLLFTLTPQLCKVSYVTSVNIVFSLAIGLCLTTFHKTRT